MKFSYRGVTVKISFLFTGVITLLLMTEMRTSALISLFSAMLHESAHAIALRRCGGEISELSFGGFGVRMELKGDLSLSLRDEIAVAAAGPAINFILAFISAALYTASEEKLFLIVCAVNTGMAFFNLIPISALDGGRILKSFMLLRFRADFSEKFSAAVSYVFLFLTLLTAFLLLLKTGFNFSMLVTGGYLILISLIKAAAD